MAMKAVIFVLALFPILGVGSLIFAWTRSTPTKTNPWVYGSEHEHERWALGEPIDYINRVHVQFSDSQRFGITCPRLRDPNNPELPKRLTRDPRGITNNTCIRIDSYEYLYGIEIPGVRWLKDHG